MKPFDPYDALASGRYVFADLGSGRGGSIEHCVKRFARGSGMGFELDPNDVVEARRAGHHVFQSDVRLVRLPPKSVAFVSAMDFLEHLPTEADAAAVLEHAAPAAREFLFIRHPSFEEMEYLAALGLKYCWSDWNEHTNLMKIADYHRLFERFGWREYAIFPRGLMVDSSDDQLVPLSAPTDTQVYDPVAHEPKPAVRFDRPIYTQFDIFVRRAGARDEAWRRTLSAGLEPDSAIWPARLFPAAPARVPGDIGFYDAETSRWSVRLADGREVSAKYGAEGLGWLPFTGAFDGDGRDGMGVYDPATGSFFLRNTLDEGDADVTIGFGAPGGMPVAGNWTGSGVDTIGVYQPSTGQWFLRHANTSGPADDSFAFGPAGEGWLPVVGDWTGEGRDSVGLYDPRTASWHLRGAGEFVFGPSNGQPVAGLGVFGVYAPDWGLWVLKRENANGPADTTFTHRAPGVPFISRFDRR